MDNFNWGNFPAIKFTRTTIVFNAEAVKALGSPERIAIGFDKDNNNIFAVRPASENDKLTYSFKVRLKYKNNPVYIDGVSLRKAVIPRLGEACIYPRKKIVIAGKKTADNTLIFDITAATVM